VRAAFDAGEDDLKDSELDDARQCILEVDACVQKLASILATVNVGTEAVASLVPELCLRFTSFVCQHTLARTLSPLPPALAFSVTAHLGALPLHVCTTGASKMWEDGSQESKLAYGNIDAVNNTDVGKGWGADVLMAKRLAVLLRSALQRYQSLPGVDEVRPSHPLLPRACHSDE
jgi:hypothetical protein